MANQVKFLLGSQNNLNTLLTNKSGISAGAFYVTNDTNRLYFGKSATEIVALNAGVINVASISALPAKAEVEIGHFYYAEAENVLCVYNGQDWVQINPDTDTNLKSASVSTSVASNKATVTNRFVQETNGVEENSDANVTSSYSIEGSNIVLTAPDGQSIKLTADTYSIATAASTGNAAKINFSRANAADASRASTTAVNIKGGSNVTVSGAADGITISAVDTITTMDSNNLSVATSGEKVTLTSGVKTSQDTEAVTDEVTFAGNGEVKVSASGDEVTIAGNHYSVGAAAVTGGAKVALSNTHGTAASEVSIVGAENGNVTVSVADNKISLSAVDTQLDSVTVGNKSGGGFTLTVKDSAGNEPSTDFNPQIKFGDENPVSFVDGVATISTDALLSDVDNRIKVAAQTLDAMTFMGTTSTLPSGDMANGNAYKVITSSVTIPAGKVYQSDGPATAEVGDLIVAMGEETNGVIPTADLKWVVIPSGNEENTTYQLVASNNATNGYTATLKPDGGEAVGSIAIKSANDAIVLSGSASGNDQNIVVTHKAGQKIAAVADSSATQVVDTELSIVVPVLSTDDYGHVIGSSTRTYKIKDTDTHNALDQSKSSITGSGTSVTQVIGDVDGSEVELTTQYVGKNYDATTGGVSVAASNSGADAVITIGFEWGTF